MFILPSGEVKQRDRNTNRIVPDPDHQTGLSTIGSSVAVPSGFQSDSEEVEEVWN